MNEMRFLVFGAGAIGTYIGGSLALAGYPVVFVERDETAGILREQGLRLRIANLERAVKNPVVEASLADALAHGPFDAAIFAIKSFDTAGALEGMTHYAAQMPPVLCLQNGVENESVLAAGLGSQKVIAGTVTSAVGRRGLGDIQLERLRGMGVAGGHALSAQLVEALLNAGLNARLYPRADAMKWSKMLTNLMGNATSAILQMPPGEVFANLRLAITEVQQLREALQVMAKLSIPVVNLPGTPVRLMAFVTQMLPPSLAGKLMRGSVVKGRGDKMPSFYIDLAAGRKKSEVTFLNGAVARLGASVGVLSPVNQGLTDILMSLVEGREDPAFYAHQPERLLSQIEKYR